MKNNIDVDNTKIITSFTNLVKMFVFAVICTAGILYAKEDIHAKINQLENRITRLEKNSNYSKQNNKILKKLLENKKS